MNVRGKAPGPTNCADRRQAPRRRARAPGPAVPDRERPAARRSGGWSYRRASRDRSAWDPVHAPRPDRPPARSARDLSSSAGDGRRRSSSWPPAGTPGRAGWRPSVRAESSASAARATKGPIGPAGFVPKAEASADTLPVQITVRSSARTATTPRCTAMPAENPRQKTRTSGPGLPDFTPGGRKTVVVDLDRFDLDQTARQPVADQAGAQGGTVVVRTHLRWHQCDREGWRWRRWCRGGGTGFRSGCGRTRGGRPCGGRHAGTAAIGDGKDFQVGANVLQLGPSERAESQPRQPAHGLVHRPRHDDAARLGHRLAPCGDVDRLSPSTCPPTRRVSPKWTPARKRKGPGRSWSARAQSTRLAGAGEGRDQAVAAGRADLAPLVGNGGLDHLQHGAQRLKRRVLVGAHPAAVAAGVDRQHGEKSSAVAVRQETDREPRIVDAGAVGMAMTRNY